MAEPRRTVGTEQGDLKGARILVVEARFYDDIADELLKGATATERGHLLWAAACRRYDLIGEFAEAESLYRQALTVTGARERPSTCITRQ